MGPEVLSRRLVYLWVVFCLYVVVYICIHTFFYGIENIYVHTHIRSTHRYTYMSSITCMYVCQALHEGSCWHVSLSVLHAEFV